MSVQTKLCVTCREFVNDGMSDSIMDIGHHNEVRSEIERMIGGRNHTDTGTTEPDAFKPCNFCESVTDTLFIFDVSDEA